MKKQKNLALYIFAAIILLVFGRFVQVRFTHFLETRGTQAPTHSLNMVTSNRYYTGGSLVAALQLSSLEGEPVEGAITASIANGDTEPLVYTTTETQDTRAQISLPLYNVPSGWYDLRIRVASALGTETFYHPIHVQEDNQSNFIINFDKGLYNPGDDVLFRVLALTDTQALPMGGNAFTISIFDGNDNRVFVENVVSSPFGIMHGRFSLGDEVNSGMYRLEVAEDGRAVASANFEVSPFVLPRFEVVLEATQTVYHIGETIYLTGTATYFFGEPVNQGTVAVYINGLRHTAETPLDAYGQFTITYEAHTQGRYEFWVEVIDNSNYRIEVSTTVYAQDGAFAIEVLPEFGHLVRGMPNRMYIFTHTPGGEPVRTFLQITGDGFSRQVATCENGIGIFILEDALAMNHITIHAQDENGDSVREVFSFPGQDSNVTMRTNRPRYARGETIYVELTSQSEGGTFKVFAYRNQELLKIVTTDQDRVALDLGDAFGIIDIYAVWVAPWEIFLSRTAPQARRTIFIDPGRYMTLGVDSAQGEYMPGEFVTLNFTAQDNAGAPLDAALLVSIVDQAMLSLAANDLSICNIRLALDGINFGPDLDGATLYTALIAGASEQAITRLLLRQSREGVSSRTFHIFNQDPLGRSALESRRDTQRIFALGWAMVVFFLLLHGAKVSEKGVAAVATQGTKGRKNAIVLVLSVMALTVLALVFLSSCGADDGAQQAAPAMDRGTVSQEVVPTTLPMATTSPMGIVSEAARDSIARQSVVDNIPGIATNAPPVPPAAEAATPAPEPPQAIETQTARVRRLFLETMLFVPELVTQNGQADLSFILADNITTWNIQVVGNTMDGIVGHTQSSIRAFQPFFVDFELPRNSIRYDRVSIPVTVFNYTEADQDVILTIAEMDWFYLHGEAVQILTVPQGRSVMMYVPITITQFGDFVFRAYADALGFADAAERPISVNPEGFRVRHVVSSGSIESSTWQHVLFMQDNIPDTRRATVTFYPSVMATVLEGMENIFRMPFGCFEQTSSILYPNILVLRYMEQNNLANPELTQRALGFISSGYQRLLTFEVPGTPGGFSLFGHAPAETVLTAYGLMQLHALTEVYTIDDRVLDRMADFLFDQQQSNGTFHITGRSGHMSNSQRLAFNAYMIWALSETFPTDPRLNQSVAYLVSQLDNVDDNYTLALIANVLVNTGHDMADSVIATLVRGANMQGNTAYMTSTTRDYFGAFGRMQYLQATALTSLVLSRHGQHQSLNDLFINYIINQRDSWGTWHSTQATILSLKALIAHAPASPLEDGQITLTMGNQVRTIDIVAENALGFYQVSFDGLEQENILDIHFPDLGRMTYKIVLEYFAPYASVELNRGFEITANMNTNLSVHELVEQEIRIINTSGDIVKNGLVAVSIPQGFRVERSSLTLMQHAGVIERYEMRFDNINLYLRDTDIGEIIDLVIAYRPAFPVEVVGGHVRVFDYYNPMVEGYLMPVEIIVQ